MARERINNFSNKHFPVLLGSSAFLATRELDVATTMMISNRGGYEANNVGGPLSPQSLFEHFGVWGLVGDAAAATVLVGALGVLTEKALAWGLNTDFTDKRLLKRPSFLLPASVALLGLDGGIHNLGILMNSPFVLPTP